MIAAAYQRPDAPIHIGQLFVQFLQRHELTQQQAGYDLGVRDETISRAIHGTGPLDLWALSRLKSEHLVAFLKSIIRARVEAELENIVADKKAMVSSQPVSVKRSA
jgi:hypothetical protein